MTQPEAKLSQAIIKAWKARTAYAWKVWGNEMTPAGTPDIVGVYRGLFVACESKMPGGHLSAIQEYRIGRMRMAGGFVIAPCFDVESAVHMLDVIDASAEGSELATIDLVESYGPRATFPRVRR